MCVSVCLSAVVVTSPLRAVAQYCNEHVCVCVCLSAVVVTSPLRAVAKYCNEHVCVCVCLSASISPEPRAQLLPIFVHVAYGRDLPMWPSG